MFFCEDANDGRVLTFKANIAGFRKVYINFPPIGLVNELHLAVNFPNFAASHGKAQN